MSGFLRQTQMLHDCQGNGHYVMIFCNLIKISGQSLLHQLMKKNTLKFLPDVRKRKRKKKKKASIFKLGIADCSSLSLFSILRHATLTSFQGHSLHHCLAQKTLILPDYFAHGRKCAIDVLKHTTESVTYAHNAEQKTRGR